jgi:hypothetical protein
MANTHRSEQLKIALADWSEPACKAAMAQLVGCVRSNDEVLNLDVLFVVAERALDHGEFFRDLVATGFDVSPEYGILAEIYLDGPCILALTLRRTRHDRRRPPRADGGTGWRVTQSRLWASQTSG